MTIFDMTAAQIWAAWKSNRLTVGQVVSWQQHTGQYFDEQGNVK